MKRGTLKVKTFERYDELTRTHIVPRIGWVPLVKISPQQIKSLYRAIFDAGRSASTVRRVAMLLHKMLLHKMFEDARREGLVGQNPVDYSDPPQNARYEPHLWSDEQVQLFLGEARRSSRLYPLYLAAIDTGGRIGELLAVSWDDFNPVFGVLSIKRTLTRPKGGGVLFGGPKSASNQGDIDVSPEVGQALEVLRAEPEKERQRRELCPQGMSCRSAACPCWHETGLVFTQPNGKPLHAKKIAARDFRRVIERAGLPRIRVHDLRHVCGSYFTRRLGIKAAQERLRHSTPTTTMRFYVHNRPGQQAEVARVLSDLLRPATHL